MPDGFTLRHAIRKSSAPELNGLVERYRPDQRINPRENRIELVEDLARRIPEEDIEEIVFNKFGVPKRRYIAHIGIINFNLIDEDELRTNIDDFNISKDFNRELPEYEPQIKQQLELVRYNDQEIVVYFRRIVKKPEYDFEEMNSKVIRYPKSVRILIKRELGIVTIFTGDRDLFNEALTALTLVFDHAVRPLDSNQTGITDALRGSFSARTVKFLDYIYHGLSQVGTVGTIYQIELETIQGSREPQQVTVKGGSDLIDDRSICEYLFWHGRDLVGIKMNLLMTYGENEHRVSVQIGIRNGKTKVGIKKENYSMEKVRHFYERIERNIVDNITQYGLINEELTHNFLETIRARVPREALE
ncbi:hypothetical protein BTA31_20980 [Bacillus haynesii]|uniref:Uncharacterized protein n=1 Tax=Bacillus haynesii TaxID=1925021 RepID=A0ABX3HY03_9BACI|nr:hypothetical protein [Bacillus haynesii]OMI24876.1 hypothetical protein BTA31_20980 [Bacillus haynesii]